MPTRTHEMSYPESMPILQGLEQTVRADQTGEKDHCPRTRQIRQSQRRFRLFRIHTVASGMAVSRLVASCQLLRMVVSRRHGVYRSYCVGCANRRETLILDTEVMEGMAYGKITSRAVIGALLLSVAAFAQTHRVDSDTGIETWETRTEGVTLSLTQILPDQARAFYINRGFPAAATERYATSCVFMAVLRNDAAPGVVKFRLDDWDVLVSGERRALISLDAWLESLQAYDLDRAALIAFRWAQFPPEQEYEPGGDWNQGMLTTGLAPDARFDLLARWVVAGKHYEGVLRNVRCAR